MKHRIFLLVIVGLFLLQSMSAYGAVEVTLDSLDPAIQNANPWFTVRTGYTRHDIHRIHGHSVDMRVVEAGVTTKDTGKFLQPLFLLQDQCTAIPPGLPCHR